MKILAINPNLLHDSGAALVINGQLAAAVNEERLTRVKQQRGVPVKSVEMVLKIAGLRAADLDAVHIVGYPPIPKILALSKTFWRLFWLLKFDLLKISFSKDKFQSIISRRLGPTNHDQINLLTAALSDILQTRQLIQKLKREGFRGQINYVAHHLCHLWAAYRSSGFLEKCLVVNIEGTSFEYTTNIYIGERGVLTKFASTPDPHSAGHYYACFTEILGFRPGFHEGKVTGLSAYGRVKSRRLSGRFSRLYSTIEPLIRQDGYRIKVSPEVFLYPFYYSTHHQKLPPELRAYSKEEIAFAAQKRLEDVICQLIKHCLIKTGCQRVVLTGGVAANVRLNQAVKQIKGVKQIYIYPAMGDFGNAHGAAVALLKPKQPGYLPNRLTNLYLGPQYTNDDIERYIKRYKLTFKYINQGLESILAQYLQNGQIICLFQGRMEYGPRALGNRSIIALGTDPKISQRLNAGLKRSEFMPFAPVVLYEQRHKCFKNIRGAQYSGEFMTITFEASDYLKKSCPAIVHVDGTARPQLLKRPVNPFYYDILSQLHILSGIPILINTSFNIHDEPIVCSPEDAIKAFLKSKFDYLVMDKFLIKND